MRELGVLYFHVPTESWETSLDEFAKKHSYSNQDQVILMSLRRIIWTLVFCHGLILDQPRQELSLDGGEEMKDMTAFFISLTCNVSLVCI